MNIKKTIQLMTLVSLTGSQCWGAAAPTFEEKKRERDEKILGALIPDTQEQILLHLDPNKLRELIVINPEFAKFPAVKKIGQLLGKNNWNVQNALFDAAQNNMPWAINYLLAHGAQIDAIDGNGVTALMFASVEGHTEVVAQLLTAGATVDHADTDGDTALIWASEDGHTEVVAQLLTAGATVDHTDSRGNTALMLAAEKGHPTTVELLLQHGAIVDHTNHRGNIALMLAAEKGHPTTVELLLQHGATFDEETKAKIEALGVEIPSN